MEQPLLSIRQLAVDFATDTGAFQGGAAHGSCQNRVPVVPGGFW